MKLDLTGKRAGRLLVIGYAYSKNNARYWKCRCDCGNKIHTTTASLNSNNTRSCGCLQKEKAGAIGRRILTKHGLSKDENGKNTRLFRIWMGIKTRCFNKNVVEYPRYGGKGVRICAAWMKFENFHKWSMENGYKKNLSIERKDVNGNYEPSNCTWATDKEQCRNRTNSRFLTFRGETKTLIEFSEMYSLPMTTVHARLGRGWSIKDALTIPLLSKNQRLKNLESK